MLMPRNCHVDNPWTLLPAGILGLLWKVGIGGVYRMMGELGPPEEECRKKALRGQKRYNYAFFTATEEEARERGLCSLLLRKWQELAQKDELPIWIEATTERSRRMYERCGFELVGEN
ncbi:hypothetical protein QTJ16_001113 [Diplocarpon rosae]|uniref:GCN5-related N-acetyltransferase Rv2170-like domain-containing protein n=1 Tax=Diplocarpon rosae TaxID=946125 RepID=A0AAD9T5E0_9HELO|nr:hypothetical protein QTJ16_001113 [Diplocarpon rosae]